MRIGCVVMAAGDARRFGENKLSALFRGKSLVRRALDAVPEEAFAAVAVVTQYPEVEALAEEYGFTPVRNRHPDWGISHTIALGLEALGEVDAALFQVSDQPLLRRESVAALVEFYRERPEAIAALGHNGVRGNPCLFPAAYFPQLYALTEDHGGSSVIRRHEAALRLLEVNPRELCDADTPEDLTALAAT